MLGDHWMIYKGPYVFESCARIPFIISTPGGSGGQEHSGLVCQLDLLPTILDLCGVEAPDERRLQENDEYLPKLGQVSRLNRWPGISLAPVLNGDQTLQREAVVIHNDDPYLGLKIRTLVTERFKITFYAGQEYGELFDLKSDPQELNNLWDDPAWVKNREQLLHQLIHEDTRLAPWYPVPYRTA
jgi:arylsulfatase A-like enzyme